MAKAAATLKDAPQTPMMQQFLLAKAEHPDCIVFFRMGDFYEMFFEDAVEAAEILGIALTSRNKDADEPIPMAGIPHHAKNAYLRTLLEAGRKVAICDQVEDPKQAKGIVRREVTQVVTPGVVLDMESLEAGENNYLVAVCQGLQGHGLAVADVSTGEFRATLLADAGALESELLRLEPRELLVEPGGAGPLQAAVGRVTRGGGVVVDELDAAAFHPKAALERLKARALMPAPGAGVGLADEALRAAGALLAYLERTQQQLGVHLGALEPYEVRDHLVIDDAAKAHLELVRTLMEGRKKGSLLGVLDRTCTAMGSRRLRQWLLMPLLDVARIEARLDRVEALVAAPLERDELRGLLKRVHDLERLNSRVATGIASPRDLDSLRQSLESLPHIQRALRSLGVPALQPLAQAIDPLPDVQTRLAAALADEPPATLKDGGVIRQGYSAELDDLLGLARDGRSWIAEYEAEERRVSGITSLKVKYNRVFGYYMEVTKANLHLVPDRFIRKQTLANAERFFTPALKEFEEKVLHAEERRVALEVELFEALRADVAAERSRILATARAVADLDVTVALAEVAQRERYVRPTLDASRRLVLKASRHPVIEQTTTDARFVPNDVTLDADDARLLIITGPNMAGKSTVMRQVALTVVLAQMGSFVPADAAHVGVVDRVFTRVGASDNLARGQSTFMVEMTETAHILKNATDRSLIVLDEIGRGTSTYDGVSIAWAVAEHIHDTVGARTLFATHYHELTDLVRTRPGARNLNIAVKEWKDEIIFLRKLLEGGTSRSYGIQVGRLAGLPDAVVSRAKEILSNLEIGDLDEECQPRLSHSPRGRRKVDSRQLNLFVAPTPPAAAPSEVERRVRALDPDTLSPIEALNVLYELRKNLPPE